MWLLSTDRAELHHFASPELVPGGYAILSHTWGEHEQSFKVTQDLAAQCKATGQNPRDLATAKVQRSCILARRHGYQWIWNDTCCIDKTSSTELSEAINSMFLWYSRAEVCFAYLQEIGRQSDVHALGSEFRTARWNSRGWTLQELIAPSLVIFVSRDWTTIGDKMELAPLLETITGIPRQVLTRKTHFSSVSIAERMSWASTRDTTRLEDEAYCLMGLFNVNMPTIYGEGRQAFRRLQHEIMKQSFDTSLFAWHRCLSAEALRPLALHDIYQFFDTPSFRDHVYLLASSPKNFIKLSGSVVHYTPSVSRPLQLYLDWQWEKNPSGRDPRSRARSQHGPFGRVELPTISATSFGLQCRFPVIDSDGLTIAVLLCDNGREHIGLLLHPSPDPVQDPFRRKYRSGYCFRLPSGGIGFARLLFLGNDFYNLRINGKTVTAEWRDILVGDSSPPFTRDVVPMLSSSLHSIAPTPPFRLPQWLVGRLMLLGMDPVLPLLMVSNPVNGKLLHTVALFVDMNTSECIHLVLGTCVRRRGLPASHWAMARPQHLDDWSERLSLDRYNMAHEPHNCLQHHIDAWPRWTKDFGDAERTVRLSFSRCELAPDHTRVVHVELEGRVYTAMKERAKIAFPPREEMGLGADVVGPHMHAALPLADERLSAPVPTSGSRP
ncbi:hypothetical protein V8D89_003421 [Ganoderma adspersum]